MADSPGAGPAEAGGGVVSARRLTRATIAIGVGASAVYFAFRTAAGVDHADPSLSITLAVLVVAPVWAVDDLVQGCSFAVAAAIPLRVDRRARTLARHVTVRGVVLLAVWLATMVTEALMAAGLLGGRAHLWLPGTVLIVVFALVVASHMTLRLCFPAADTRPPDPQNLRDLRERASIPRRCLERVAVRSDQVGMPFGAWLRGLSRSQPWVGLATIAYAVGLATGVGLDIIDCEGTPAVARDSCRHILLQGGPKPEVLGDQRQREGTRPGKQPNDEEPTGTEGAGETTTTSTTQPEGGCGMSLPAAVTTYLPEVVRLPSRIKVALLRARSGVIDDVAGCVTEDSELSQVGPGAWAVTLTEGRSDPFTAVAFTTEDGVKAAQVFDRQEEAFRKAVTDGGVSFVGPLRNSGAGNVQFYGGANGSCRAAFRTPWRRHGASAVLLGSAETRAVTAFALKGLPAADGLGRRAAYLPSVDATVSGDRAGVQRRRVSFSWPGDPFERVVRDLVSTVEEGPSGQQAALVAPGAPAPRRFPQRNKGGSGTSCAELDEAFGAVVREACLQNASANPEDCVVFKG